MPMLEQKHVEGLAPGRRRTVLAFVSFVHELHMEDAQKRLNRIHGRGSSRVLSLMQLKRDQRPGRCWGHRGKTWRIIREPGVACVWWVTCFVGVGLLNRSAVLWWHKRTEVLWARLTGLKLSPRQRQSTKNQVIYQHASNKPVFLMTLLLSLYLHRFTKRPFKHKLS